MSPAGDAIRMSVPLYGARTSTSTRNPRMELREKYEWSLPEGTHKMSATVEIIKTIPGVDFDLG